MIFVIILSIIIAIIDQISKFIITKTLTFNSPLLIIKNFFYLTYTHNKGAAFSLLNGKTVFLIITALFIIFFLINYLRREKPQSKIIQIAFSFVIGGSLGNLIDRLVRGYVIDFFDFKIFNYDFPIFNLADSFLTIGVIILFILTFRKEDKNANR